MIINSLLDTDYYKFTMGQYIWKYYPDEQVTFSFINRTKDVNLLDYIDIKKLNKEIFNVRNLKFTFEELHYLKKLKIFDNNYLQFLNTLELPAIFAYNDNGQLKIETIGLWKEVTFWETFILSIINELYYQKRHIPISNTWGKDRLEYKIKVIQAYRFKFSDFGTRRRYSHSWQRFVLKQLKENTPSKSFLGTSNVYFAKKLDLKPIGTFAHEIPMVICGMNKDNMPAAHRRSLFRWFELYGYDLSIALTDTYGSDFFFREGIEFPEEWKGLRQDSGCPFKFINKAIYFYQYNGINSKDKLIIFSDGLDIDKIMKLEKKCNNKIQTAYGWGTNLTNDCGNKPLSLVMKATKVNDYPLVKLSDNLNKAVGDKEEIKRVKKIFGYKNEYKDATIY